MYSAAYIWAKTITYLEERLSAVTVSAWLDDAELVELHENRLVIYSPSDFRQETIRRNCKPYIEDALRELFHMDAELEIWGDAQLTQYRQEKTSKSLWEFNPQFNFDNFIAGTANEIPLRAAMHVAEHLGDSVYNPLFYYGSPGVGKTHLLYAIANRIAQTYPQAKVVCVKGEQFTNELIKAIQKSGSSPAEFRKKYREADILLIDDIQFIAGKEATQEEFFHTFNYLFELRKQIVITSDRRPGDIATLEDRLKGRFGEGVMMKIENPDYATRCQIIKSKAKQLGLSLDEDSVRYIAGKLCDNVRQIEGGLHKIRAFHDLSGMELTVEHIARTIEDIQGSESTLLITPALIVRNVCRYYGVEDEQLKSRQRSRNISEPRQVAMYLIRQMTAMSFPDIGKYFARDHGTVCVAVKKVEDALSEKGSRMGNVLKDIRMNIETGT